jgi:hypothetical protein
LSPKQLGESPARVRILPCLEIHKYRMRHFINLVETYSNENKWAADAISDTDFDYYSNWWLIVNFAEEHGLEAEFEEAAGEPIADLSEESPELFEKLPKETQKGIEEYVISYLSRHDPADLPSSHHFMLKTNTLPRSTWLVHFTDHAYDIMNQGFTHGTLEADKLGLTTHHSHEYKKYGGYNFAFVATSRDARWGASKKQYGKQCIMFQSSGVEAYHYGDEEDQVIFWGPNVDRHQCVQLHDDGGDWAIHDTKTDRVLFSGDFEKAVAWVMVNFRQYKNRMLIR